MYKDLQRIISLRMELLHVENMTHLAKLSGVSRTTAMNIRNGYTKNPGILTVSALESAIEKHKSRSTSEAA